MNSSRDKIIGLLRKAGSKNNGWVSGEEIARELHISRNAVSKNINGLRQADYLIESIVGCGYKLVIESDSVDIAVIKSQLKTKIIGRSDWVWFEETPSTNREAIILGADSVRDGAVIIATKQVAGRGRRGHSWFSAPRSLQLSVLLEPHVEINEQKLTHWAMNALNDTIAHFTGISAKLKEPNDVLLNNKKVAGVLVDTLTSGGETSWFVVGIGCNVNVAKSEFPADIAEHATSIFAECGRILSRNDLYAHLINKLDYYVYPA
ncbi:biotin--[acetyl-CoA-carboxylase] ligase [Deferribacterales bacterium RsTz2092]|nr:bifunctional ligase/repressor BirA [Deferribacterales bacterium]